jgi:hypothetical protein
MLDDVHSVARHGQRIAASVTAEGLQGELPGGHPGELGGDVGGPAHDEIAVGCTDLQCRAIRACQHHSRVDEHRIGVSWFDLAQRRIGGCHS